MIPAPAEAARNIKSAAARMHKSLTDIDIRLQIRTSPGGISRAVFHSIPSMDKGILRVWKIETGG